MSFLRETWLRICNLMMFSPTTQTSLRDKAIAVAERVTTVKDKKCSKVSCPVCLTVLQISGDLDLRMTLALHLSLWHPDDVKLQWDIMHNKKQSIIHLPSFVIGVGMAAGFGALLALSAKNQHRLLPVKKRR
ncbi:hypothetical protein CDL12_25954 [Handroanthus impetiginosus]|uniref:Uncharacterized protein n=1 Tax=Handroanthus impetiginosus TaxID=429701 RepID=A0A2G9G986_9LAMI|nr:hypothetical protein CDL12_25954 [Handroanthus impetiginosus]